VACCDHYHRQRRSRRGQALLQLDATQTWHLNVRDDTGKVVPRIPSQPQEILCRREALRGVAGRSNQRNQAVAHGLVVVDDRDQGLRWHAVFLLLTSATAAWTDRSRQPLHIGSPPGTILRY